MSVLVKGLILVHLDWPWSYRPQEITPRCLDACHSVLNTLTASTEHGRCWRGPIVQLTSPKAYQLTPVPAHIKPLTQFPSDLQIAAAHDLETVGAAIARQFSDIRAWIIAGFWQDLCCADIRYGLRQVTPFAMIPHNWSTSAEIQAAD